MSVCHRDDIEFLPFLFRYKDRLGRLHVSGGSLAQARFFRNSPFPFVWFLVLMSVEPQVSGFLGGERDYGNLKGDTGPLVYPAGFLYVYSAIRYVTGGEVYPAQVLDSFPFFADKFAIFCGSNRYFCWYLL